ncbi:hypothetical protein ACFT54_10085 [Streptomyces cinereoruber]|uniref:hypothetical protein n=1 Tax=Streptomyces cinereoruber TaxID=67260 RepID=UPI00363B4A3A
MTKCTTGRTPYNADHVAIVDAGETVTAVYIPDPEQAKEPAKVVGDITDRKYVNVEVVATARRFYKKDGADFSGWVVESGPHSYSDPVPNKPQAMTVLRDAIRGYFQR